jgi:hypothetical protein
MHRFRFPMMHRHAAASGLQVPPGETGHTRLHKVLWFVVLWCAGVAGAMLLALPFRLLMNACMQ